MSDWRSSTGVREDTDQVQLYTPHDLKQVWQEEAEERGTSMSSYLKNLIQEARFPRQQGQLKIGDRRQVPELKDRIEELEQQLDSQNQQTPNPDHEFHKTVNA